MQSMNGNKRTYHHSHSPPPLPNNVTFPPNSGAPAYSDAPSVSSSSTPRHAVPADTPNVYSQHDELIGFMTDSWNKVCHQISEYNRGLSGVGVIQYYNADPNNSNSNTSEALKHFKPIDLEDFWGKRVHQNLTRQNSQTY